MTLISTTLATLALITSTVATDLNVTYPETVNVLAACESPNDFHNLSEQVFLDNGEQMLELPIAEARIVKLVTIGDDYDIWLENQLGDRLWGARQSGANISNLTPDAISHHLLLNLEQGQVEHFLFTLQLDGTGELIWSSAASSALTSCNT